MLVVRAPMFHSAGDEEAFSWWLRKIRAVSRVSRRGHDMHIELRPGKITSDEHRELRALFHRYALDTTELGGLDR